MLNCLQVRNVFAATPEELQEDLNRILQELGKRVQEIKFISPLSEGFACSVIYWSQNIPAEMTAKIEDLPEDPKAKAGDPVFVCVLHDYQRQFVKDALTSQWHYHKNESLRPINNAAEQDMHAELAEKCFALLLRFENDNEQPEMAESQGCNTP